MLYILWKGNHPEVTYRGGQESIVHLVADVRSVAATRTSHRSRPSAAGTTERRWDDDRAR